MLLDTAFTTQDMEQTHMQSQSFSTNQILQSTYLEIKMTANIIMIAQTVQLPLPSKTHWFKMIFNYVMS